MEFGSTNRLKRFARSSSEEMPLPPPVPQEWLDYLEEIDPPPPLRDDAGIDIDDVPGIMPVSSHERCQRRSNNTVNKGEESKEKPGNEVLPASAIRKEESWADLIPSFSRNGDEDLGASSKKA